MGVGADKGAQRNVLGHGRQRGGPRPALPHPEALALDVDQEVVDDPERIEADGLRRPGDHKRVTPAWRLSVEMTFPLWDDQPAAERSPSRFIVATGCRHRYCSLRQRGVGGDVSY